MLRYIVRRVLWGIALLVIVSAVVFVLFYVFPSADPAKLRAGRTANPQLIEQIREQLHLDDPIYVQFWDYMKGVFLHFDFGRSFTSQADVRTIILDRLPATALLVAGSVVIWLMIGLPVGIISAVMRRSLLDRSTMIITLAFISAPVFWLGLVALYLFADDVGVIHIFPGIGSYLSADTFLAKCESMLLPWMVLAAATAAIYARYLRSSMIDTMSEDYIRTARAKGLSRASILLKHALRNAAIPVVAIAAVQLGFMLGGSIVIEQVFALHGVGFLAWESIGKNDFPVVQAVVLVLAVIYVALTMLADLMNAVLDPRLRGP